MIDPKQLTDNAYFEQLALGLVGLDEDLEGPDANDARVQADAARRALDARGLLGDEGEIPAWMVDYQRLLDAGWKWRVAAYIAWAASPKRERWPKTQAELANTVLGLTSDRVIHQWRAKYPAIDSMIAVLQAAPLMAHRRDVFEALVDSASRSDYKSNPDRKLFLELTGDYRNTVDVNHGGIGADDLSEYSDEELRRMAGKGVGSAANPPQSPPTPPLARGAKGDTDCGVEVDDA